MIQGRISFLFLLLFFSYALLLGRLYYVQVICHLEYQQQADRIHYREILVPAKRGDILDRNGEPLARTVRSLSVFAHPDQIPVEKKAEVSRLLSQHTGVPLEVISAKLSRKTRFVWIARNVDWRIKFRLQKLRREGFLPGVDYEEGFKRLYPAGDLASNTLGFTNIDGFGIEGLEASLNPILSGKPGLISADVDARGEILPGSRRWKRLPVDGASLRLSLDLVLQGVAEAEVDKAVQQYQAKGATCIVMDVQTGEILAMAVNPRFNPNEYQKSKPETRRNRSLTDRYEPGSTLKAITAAAALETGIFPPESTAYCPGRIQVGRRTVRCVLHGPFRHGHGTVHLREILRYSCNVGAATVGLRLGSSRLREFLHRFGFGQKTGIECPGEALGLLPTEWSNITTANVAFGQGVAVTPLQLLRAYAAIANDGVLVKPTLLKQSQLPKGQRIISSETAQTLKEYLIGVVERGTGKTAKIPGYKVAGKTGSAQKVAEGGKGYAPGKFIASFVGFLPADSPRVAILAVVDEPQGVHWGATVAAPIFREVARQAVIRLKIPPNYPEDHFDGADPRTWPKEKD